jgi:general secretion pathway protein K
MTALRPCQRGAALLLAMIILALVATAVAGMVWQQTRAVSIEAAERARSQSAWILNAALDWARLILREDQRGSQGGQSDNLGEPWAQPLAESRLSSFLAADKDNNADSGPEAFISGAIEDAQSRLNLRGLVDGNGKVVEPQRDALARLCNLAGAPSDTAERIALALAATVAAPAPGTAAEAANNAPIKPQQVSDLAWLGVDAPTLARLAPFVELLPVETPVNVNTAPREVLAAVNDIGLGEAERLVQARQRDPFKNIGEVKTLLNLKADPEPNRLSVNSNYFIVSGRLRLEERVLEEKSLLWRNNNRVDVLRRERRSLSVTSGVR